ncbi:hypothetical protein JST56_05140 [Candidatus Dependentiae bacterium]|nr:hypothetical protein [Candidatus Dependentiae bacterium]
MFFSKKGFITTLLLAVLCISKQVVAMDSLSDELSGPFTEVIIVRMCNLLEYAKEQYLKGATNILLSPEEYIATLRGDLFGKIVGSYKQSRSNNNFSVEDGQPREPVRDAIVQIQQLGRKLEMSADISTVTLGQYLNNTVAYWAIRYSPNFSDHPFLMIALHSRGFIIYADIEKHSV